MYLQSLSISNVLSFSAHDHTDAHHTITRSGDNDNRVNIVIGPNGSGKSNALEVINQALKVGWFKNYLFTPSMINSETPSHTICHHETHTRHIYKHFATSQSPATVVVTIGITEHDKDNFRFLMKHQGLLQKLLTTYSDAVIDFPYIDHVDDIMRVSALVVKITLDTQTKTASSQLMTSSPVLSAWYWYFEYFELFQMALIVHNHHLHVDDPLPGLHGNFAVLGPSRDFAEDDINYGTQKRNKTQLDEVIHNQDMKRNHQLPVGYYLVKKQLLEMYHRGDFTRGSQTSGLLADEFLMHNEIWSDTMNFYQKLNYLVRKYVNLMVIPSFHDDQISLHFVDKRNNYYTLSELSSGEQAFLAIIFTLRGYGLMDGLLIIDEPEQHLHPQMQSKMLEMIEDIADKYRLQVIMATHSPLMISETTINAVHRCSIQDSGTMVWSSTRSQFADDEYRLIQMLQYGYTAKVFFVDTIIMVEGETDEYFFDFYLRHLRQQPGWHHKIKNFAVINVNGKGGYKRRKSFLKRFGIRSYFVGDWDNIVDTGLSISFKKLINEMRHDTHKGFRKGKKRKDYGALTYYIYHYKPKTHRMIQSHINTIEKRDVFILRRGDLEAYLGLDIKGVDSTVEFCHEHFDSRLKNKKFDPYRKELERIFGMMFG